MFNAHAVATASHDAFICHTRHTLLLLLMGAHNFTNEKYLLLIYEYLNNLMIMLRLSSISSRVHSAFRMFIFLSIAMWYLHSIKYGLVMISRFWFQFFYRVCFSVDRRLHQIYQCLIWDYCRVSILGCIISLWFGKLRLIMIMLSLCNSYLLLWSKL